MNATLPPRGFTAAGTVSEARLSDSEPFFATAAKRVFPSTRHLRGIRYEKAVAEAVQAWGGQHGVAVAVGPWFTFYSAPPAAWRWCQPDLVLDPGSDQPLVILEVKLVFEPLAWWQLAELYRPVIEKATGRKARIATVCQSFDPVVCSRIPEPVGFEIDWPAFWLAGVVLSEVLSRGLPVLQWKKPSAATLDSP